MRYIFVSAETGHPFVMFGKIAKEADVLRREGKSYASLVEAYSEHESAPRGGVVPEIAGHGEGLPLQPAVLKECRVSTYKPHRDGLHLYLRDCRMPLPFGQVKEKVREDLIAFRRNLYLRNLTEELRAKAKIELLPLKGEPPVTLGVGHGR